MAKFPLNTSITINEHRLLRALICHRHGMEYGVAVPSLSINDSYEPIKVGGPIAGVIPSLVKKGWIVIKGNQRKYIMSHNNRLIYWASEEAYHKAKQLPKV